MSVGSLVPGRRGVALRSRTGAGATLLLLAGTCTVAAQQDQPVFRSGVQIIEVDVRVFDRQGRFVTDLTREDFEILEGGVPQRLETFYLVTESGTVPVSGEDRGTVPLSGVLEAKRGTVPLFTPQTWIFVFDLNHLTPGAGFERARAAVQEFIRERFREGDIAGVVAGTRMVNNRLTSVREELVQAANSVKPLPDARNRSRELRQEWPRFQDETEAFLVANENRDAIQRVVIRACSDDPDACGRVPPDTEVRQKARRLVQAFQSSTLSTLNAAAALASGLAKMPGPKTVVLLSDGFVAEQMETSVQQVAGQMARAGARIYAIDVRGLDRGRGSGIVDQGVVEDPAGALPAFDAQADAPNSLAVDTGGLMIRNENNIGRALDRIAVDSSQYYVIGYQPTNPSFDGKFRPIDVRVKRDEVRVRARRGYLALDPARLLTGVPQVPQVPPVPEVQVPRVHDTPPRATEPRELEPEEPVEPVEPEEPVEPVEPEEPVEPVLRLRPDTAERIRTMAEGQPTARGLAERGWEAYQRGDVAAALPLLREAAADSDVRPWVVYALGWSQMALGQASQAAASWEQVRIAAPEFEPVYMDLADVYIQLREVSKALAVLRDAEQRWPDDPDIHNAVGVIHVRRGALDAAIAAFTRAQAVAPDEALTYFNLGRAYEMRYAQGLRYVSSQRRWTSSDDDRRKAMEYYQQYVERGGPYVRDAREAIGRLEWSGKPAGPGG